MNRVITFTDKNYFHFGELFIKTRHLVNADFVLYGPDLTEEQRSILKHNDITYLPIDEKDFQERMQYLKFELLRKNLDEVDEGDGISFVDFDTFFVKDWGNVFQQDIDLGITVRRDFVKKGILRAYANGGVIFCKNSKKGRAICDYAMKVMANGGDKKLAEYNTIFKTLEEGRPAHKTHYRTTLRWWVDQVFLSSLVLRAKNRGVKLQNNSIFDFGKFRIGLFDCKHYNKLDPSYSECKSIINKKSAYIIHLKKQGRDIVSKIANLFKE